MADMVRCASCGYEGTPSIWFDFYQCSSEVWPNEDERLCERCFNRELALRVIRKSK